MKNLIMLAMLLLVACGPTKQPQSVTEEAEVTYIAFDTKCIVDIKYSEPEQRYHLVYFDPDANIGEVGDEVMPVDVVVNCDFIEVYDKYSQDAFFDSFCMEQYWIVEQKDGYELVIADYE